MSDAAKITFTRSRPAEPSAFTPPFVWHWEVSYQDQTFDDGGVEFNNLDAVAESAVRKYWFLGLESREADKTVKAGAGRETEQRKRHEAEVKLAQEKAAAIAAAKDNANKRRAEALQLLRPKAALLEGKKSKPIKPRASTASRRKK
jgi:hypothetical protein